MMLVDERKLKQSMWEYRHLFTGSYTWKCSVCRDANNKRTTPLVCTDVQDYVYCVGEGKTATLAQGYCVRGICPQCMNEATTPLKDEYTPSFCDGETMNLIWHSRLRPAWLIPPAEWQEFGAPLYPLVDEAGVGPISLSLKNICDRVENMKAEMNHNYVRRQQADTHEETVLKPEMEPVVAESVNTTYTPETEHTDENASIYEFYDPYQE